MPYPPQPPPIQARPRRVAPWAIVLIAVLSVGAGVCAGLPAGASTRTDDVKAAKAETKNAREEIADLTSELKDARSELKDARRDLVAANARAEKCVAAARPAERLIDLLFDYGSAATRQDFYEMEDILDEMGDDVPIVEMLRDCSAANGHSSL